MIREEFAAGGVAVQQRLAHGESVFDSENVAAYTDDSLLLSFFSYAPQ